MLNILKKSIPQGTIDLKQTIGNLTARKHETFSYFLGTNFFL
jgi:hypothetical protein